MLSLDSKESTESERLSLSNSLGAPDPSFEELKHHNEKMHHAVETYISWIFSKSWEGIVAKHVFIAFFCHLVLK